MRVTILGCGTSGGVPRIGGAGGRGDWGAARSDDPRNRRRRCSILVEEGGRRILVDTSPDLREQLIDARVDGLDAVIWTHDHADQVNGIDDVRPLVLRGGPIEAWADARTSGILRRRFGYCFDGEPGGFYNPLYRLQTIDGPFQAAGVPVIPFQQDHGFVPSLGFRFGAFGYANDVVGLPEASLATLMGVRILVVDAMRYKPHPTHAHLDLALEWIARVKPERAYLTNLHVDMDYAQLDAMTPEHVAPCHDGMILEIHNK
ncbi:MAG: MBL fold metallo-hydrolase [Alphaproteobacteria bacterium]|nr:MBL fold metallo-hydrolase [Alphaproteobacteria bacterium]